MKSFKEFLNEMAVGGAAYGKAIGKGKWYSEIDLSKIEGKEEKIKFVVDFAKRKSVRMYNTNGSLTSPFLSGISELGLSGNEELVKKYAGEATKEDKVKVVAVGGQGESVLQQKGKHETGRTEKSAEEEYNFRKKLSDDLNEISGKTSFENSDLAKVREFLTNYGEVVDDLLKTANSEKEKELAKSVEDFQKARRVLGTEEKIRLFKFLAKVSKDVVKDYDEIMADFKNVSSFKKQSKSTQGVNKDNILIKKVDISNIDFNSTEKEDSIKREAKLEELKELIEPLTRGKISTKTPTGIIDLEVKYVGLENIIKHLKPVYDFLEKYNETVDAFTEKGMDIVASKKEAKNISTKAGDNTQRIIDLPTIKKKEDIISVAKKLDFLIDNFIKQEKTLRKTSVGKLLDLQAKNTRDMEEKNKQLKDRKAGLLNKDEEKETPLSKSEMADIIKKHKAIPKTPNELLTDLKKGEVNPEQKEMQRIRQIVSDAFDKLMARVNRVKDEDKKKEMRKEIGSKLGKYLSRISTKMKDSTGAFKLQGEGSLKGVNEVEVRKVIEELNKKIGV
jgi:hypothetical protein